MQELISSLPRVDRCDVLLDTCFLYYVLEHQKEKEFIEFCNNNKVAMSSFNAEEFVFHSHDVNHTVRERFRHLVKKDLNLSIVDVNVHPGHRQSEEDFVASVDKMLLEIIPDVSDAVMVALATKIKANILTRDKHHVFTAVLNNYGQEHGIQVYNNFY